MGRTRSQQSIIAEHKRYREQCRKRIPSSLKLSAFFSVAAMLCVLFLGASWWLVAGVVAFVAFNTGMEVFGYLHHDRKLRELGAGSPSSPEPL